MLTKKLIDERGYYDNIVNTFNEYIYNEIDKGELPKNPSPTSIKVSEEIYSSFASAMDACEIHYIQRDKVYSYIKHGVVEPYNIAPYEDALKLLPSLYQICHEKMLDLKKTCNIAYGKEKIENKEAPIFCNDDPWFYENVYMFGDIKLELES